MLILGIKEGVILTVGDTKILFKKFKNKSVRVVVDAPRETIVTRSDMIYDGKKCETVFIRDE